MEKQAKYSSDPILVAHGKAPLGAPMVDLRKPLHKCSLEDSLVVLKLGSDYVSCRNQDLSEDLQIYLSEVLDSNDKNSVYGVICDVWSLYSHLEFKGRKRTHLSAFLYDIVHCQRNDAYKKAVGEARFDEILRLIKEHFEFFAIFIFFIVVNRLAR